MVEKITMAENGKGDSYRPVNRTKWEDNYDRIFRKGTKRENTTQVSNKKSPSPVQKAN